jgi:hypothetical protein
MVSDSLTPFHLQAEDEGTYVLEARDREAHGATPPQPAAELWESTDYSD